MKIFNLKVNHVKNPIGYMIEKPIFSYLAEGNGTKKKRARIVVSLSADMTDPVYDSGWETDIDGLAYEAEMQLKPCTRYYWQVEAESDAGDCGKSEIAYFETAKKDESWKAKWIGCEENGGRAPEFLHEFMLFKSVKSARLYICGLGLYEAYIDGIKVGNEFFTPYSNNYESWLQYQTFDVGDLLHSGKNKISVLLGNGWWKGRFGLNRDGRPDKLYGDKYLLIAELHINYEDNSEEIIITDENWKWRRSSILSNSIYDGEETDDLSVNEEYYSVILAEEPKGKLTARLSTPILAMETLDPVNEIITPKGEFVLDMGQNHSGVFELRIREKKGTKIKLSFCEELQDGNFYNENLRTAKAEFLYTCDGTEKTVRPHFTWFGYRYVKIEGLTKYRKGDYKGLVLYSELIKTAEMETGNELVNQFIRNALWGQKSNFLDVPMDCPQRDERMGWTGDAQVFAPTACYQMDCRAFFKKWLYDMYEEQKIRNGGVPDCIPACGQVNSSGVWGDACTIVPWVIYDTYGDISVIRNQFESMKAWVEYIRKINGNDGRWKKVFHYGDWLALDSKNSDMPTGATDVGFVAIVYYYHSVCLTLKAAKLLGKKEDEDIYGKLANEIKQDIVNEYFSPNGRACISTQTGLLMALYFDIAPNPEKTREELRNAFKENSDKLVTGFVGTGILNSTLSQNGMNDLAYSLLLYEGYPGWLYSVKHGATTVWERWDSLDENGHFSSTGMNSLNHYSYGAIVGWLYRFVAGLKPKTSGFKETEISPLPDYRLKSVKASLNTAAGVYKSAWRVTESFGLALDVTVPFDGKAYVYLPYASEQTYMQKTAFTANIVDTEKGRACVLTAGDYHIEYETTVPMRKYYSIDSKIGEIVSDEKASAVLQQAIPMFAMLPESIHGMTFRELAAIKPQAMPSERLEMLNHILMKL